MRIKTDRSKLSQFNVYFEDTVKKLRINMPKAKRTTKICGICHKGTHTTAKCPSK